MTEQMHFSMLVQWSDEDQACVVSLPEWEGRVINPVTHGETYQQAIEHAREALSALIASARQRNESLPEPHVLAGSSR